ncbi:MAG: sigma-70 family RNA polymerase sigma factor [Balneola sp.]
MSKRANHIINEELARSYQSGERDALKELIRRFNPILTSKVYKHTRDIESLDDIVQECWYAIINNLHEVRFQVGFEAWALNIGRNKAVDWIRDQQKQRKKLSGVRREEEIFAKEKEEVRDQQIREIKACMNLLPESQKIILELFYKDNFSLAEVSEILGISKGTVKSRLFTAREHLKKIIH